MSFIPEKRTIYVFLISCIIFILGINSIDLYCSPKDSLNISVSNTNNLPDSLKIKNQNDSLKVQKNKNDLDTVITFSAKREMQFHIKDKNLNLSGDSKINFKTQKLEAENIEIDFKSNTLTANGGIDSNKKGFGFPKFIDGPENYVGSQIIYNYKTKVGAISLGETQVSDGYYFGAKIKKVSEKDLFVSKGCYTTCDAPHPHFYFGSDEMKVTTGDKIFLDPLTFYVEDMPIFTVPLGMFFPNKSGRQSGIIIPSFFFSKSKGVTFEDLGVYLALSDYYDTKFTANIYSKGGYVLKNNTRWVVRDQFAGSSDIQFGYTRQNTEAAFQKNWLFRLNHNQNITPQSSFVANVNFSSNSFYQNTSNQLSDRLTQSITSNANYTENFDNGASYSISYNRDQNIINKTYTQTLPDFSLSLPNWNPFKNSVPPTSSFSWVRDVSVRYTGEGYYRTQKTLNLDSSFTESHSSRVSHRPSISISPKLGYFTISPIISFSMNNYFRQTQKYFDLKDSIVKDRYKDGFFSEYSYSFGVNASTKLYGDFNPKMFGITGLRHIFNPTIGVSYTPDLSASKYGFYDKYYDYSYHKYVIYSKYSADDGGLASTTKIFNLNYSFNNTFQAKVFVSDTAQDKSFTFFNLNASGSYNFAADSMKLSDLSLSYRVSEIPNISLSGSAAFTFYDQQKYYDSVTKANYYGRINQYLIDNNKGLARLTNFTLTLGTNLAGGKGIGISSPTSALTSPNKSSAANISKDSISLGERFNNRMNYEDENVDLFGDSSPGFSPFNMPWSLSTTLNFAYNQQLVNIIQRTLDLSLNLSADITSSWQLSGSMGYDFINKRLSSPIINLNKSLHCWDFHFEWYPVGYNRGFYLRFGIKAPQLKDLKIEKRENPLYN